MTGPASTEREFARRQFNILKAVLFCVVLPGIGLYIAQRLSAPPFVMSVGMAAIMVSFVGCLIYGIRQSRCPACNHWLPNSPGPSGECLNCHVQLRSWPGDLPTRDLVARKRQIQWVSGIFVVMILGIIWLTLKK